jgi:hypothetical protein
LSRRVGNSPMGTGFPPFDPWNAEDAEDAEGYVERFASYPLTMRRIPCLNAEAHVDPNGAISNRELQLVLELQPARRELVMEARIVRPFQKTSARRGMNRHRRLDNLMCDVIDSHVDLILGVLGVLGVSSAAVKQAMSPA